jgi:phage RecT family recombinase
MSKQQVTVKQTTEFLNQLVGRTQEHLPQDINTELLKSNAMMYINKNEDLKREAIRNPMEIAQHLYNFVTLGLDVYRSEAYLLLFKGKITPIIDYKGLIKLVTKYSVEDILKIDVDLVHENDKVYKRNGELTHEYNPFAERGEKIGVLCSVHYANGSIAHTHMTKKEVLKVKNSSPSANSNYSPWNKWEESMWIKTVIRNAMKTIPLDYGKYDMKYGEVATTAYDNADRDIEFTNVNNRSNDEEVINQDDIDNPFDEETGEVFNAEYQESEVK